MAWTKRWRKRVRTLVRRDAVERELDEELAFHLEMETRKHVRAGMSPAEARRRAAIEFGGVEKFKEEVRDERALGWVPGMSLDFKLGIRMLLRYPGLTVVGALAMAFGIAVGAGGFELMKDQLFPPLPYAEPGRIVAIQNVSTRTTLPERRALHDFAAWRKLRSVQQLSALHSRERNLSLGEAEGTPVCEVSVSASAFDLVRVAPLLGRPLVPADEAPGAPAVAVLGHDLWRRRFGGDPGVVGRVVKLGGQPATVVGVMPEHFTLFVPSKETTLPGAQDLWVPFRMDPLAYRPGEGPAISVFGRLAPGVSIDAARAELATVAASAAGEWPETHAHLEPEVMPFARPLSNREGLIPAGALSLSALFLVLLMVILCANVALLLFARAATREGEIAVRNALGASRRRIVFQLFAEALVLSGIAIVVGLAGASVGLRWTVRVLDSMLEAHGVARPSWIGATLSPTTIGYAVALGVVGAVVAGALPGLKVTARQGQAQLQRLAGRGSGVRLGPVWNGIIVTQVALTVVFVPVAIMFGLQTAEIRSMDRALPAAPLLSVQLQADEDLSEDASKKARYEADYRALERRLAEEPGVTGVAVARDLPGSWHWRPRVEVDAPAAPPDKHAQIASVDPDFFEVLGTPLLAGRGFRAGERGVVVNESFVREFLGGRNAVGQRLRFGGDAEPWREIVGVVRDVAMTIAPTLPDNAGIYQPLVPGDAYPVRMAVRVTGDPWAFTGRLHEIAAEAAPGLRLQRAVPLSQAARALLIAHDAWFRVIVLGGAMALLLTNAGIYAIISFTVSRRTREIGVRVALGADRRRIVTSILSRTARHVGTGVLIGGLLSIVAVLAISEGSWQPTVLRSGGLLAAYMAAMMGVCMLASIVPTRRALRIEPMEALNADG
jgi:predicted permease